MPKNNVKHAKRGPPMLWVAPQEPGAKPTHLPEAKPKLGKHAKATEAKVAKLRRHGKLVQVGCPNCDARITLRVLAVLAKGGRTLASEVRRKAAVQAFPKSTLREVQRLVEKLAQVEA